MSSTKAMSQLWWILATAAMVTLVVIISIILFKSGGERGFGVIGEQLEDDDDDGVYNALDRCPNTPENVAVDTEGCPETQGSSSSNP